MGAASGAHGEAGSADGGEACWAPDAAGGGIGCEPGEGGEWSAATYVAMDGLVPTGGAAFRREPSVAAWPRVTVRGHAGLERPPIGPLSLARSVPAQRPPARLRSRPAWQVRHASDPAIAAHNLTGGTLQFGAADRVKTLGGVELLVAAAGLGAPALIFFARRAASAARERGGRWRPAEFSSVVTREL